MRQFACTDQYGTNVLGLVEALRKLGLESKGVKGKLDLLREIPLPAIAHVIIKEQHTHYIVIVSVEKDKVIVMDPAEGSFKKLTKDQFDKMWTGILIIAEPGKEFKTSRAVSNKERFLNLASPHKKELLLAFAAAILISLLGLSTALYIQKIVDEILVQRNFYLLNVITVLIVAVGICQIFTGLLKDKLVLRVGLSIDSALIIEYYKHLLKLPQQFFDTMKVGEIMSRINDAVRISAFISDVVITTMLNILIVFFSLVMMFIYYWKLALIAMAAIPVYFLIGYVNDHINKKIQRNLLESFSAFDTQVIESLTAAGAIKSLCLEKYALEKTETTFCSLMKNAYQSSMFQFYIFGAADLFTKLVSIFILWSGSYFVVAHHLSAGQLISFYSLIAFFTTPLMHLMMSSKQIRECVIAAERLFEVTDLETEKSGIIVVGGVLENQKTIQFTDIHFGYGNKQKILQGLNFTIAENSITGIRGVSGSGKSTIAALMQKLYVPAQGVIKIGPLNIDHIDNASLRKMIVSVPQHAQLFSASIIENITIGDAEPDIKKVLELAERLGITEFVSLLAYGLDTKLSMHGNHLSGGQKQRIAIARALYRDPAVLILDEATAAVDGISEKKILDTIAWYRHKGNTVVVIAHQQSILNICDTILTIGNGQIV